MCIICDKPEGVEMPSDLDIKHMFSKNPNGAGFAIQGWFDYPQKDGGVRRKFEVRYHKGFMNVDDLIEALGPKEKLKNYRVVIHCRITTSGNSDRPTTHPFPLSNNYGDLRKTDGDGPVLFHNGVFSNLGGIIDKKSSDTQDYVVGIANRMLKKPDHISAISRNIAEIVAGSCRVLILYPDPKHPDFKLGTWHEHDGCSYSNTGYRTEYSNYYCGSYYGSYNKKDDKDELEKAMEKKDYAHDYDVWGCNNALYAYPSKDNHWIKASSKERLEGVLKAAVEVEEYQDGNTYYYFSYDLTNPWLVDEDELMMYDEQGYQMYKDKLEEEEEYEAETLYDNCLWFSDLEEMEEWKETAVKISEFVYEQDGQTWYIDEFEYVAYTDEGLKLMFGPGASGHVRKAIKENGYDTYTPSRKGY